MLRTKLDHLKNKVVEVRANGLIYKGKLIEATDSEITLRRQTGFISIAMENVSSIVDPTEKEQRKDSTFIDPSFFSVDDDSKS